ncbi:hypothetical protein AB834_01995 [PVC group bacterium (ex Bugula neritina AB1)]|nr:hypothetical protein AB834_01995 [PVC group bacterium (ex Bugula neritina AB1)]
MIKKAKPYSLSLKFSLPRQPLTMKTRQGILITVGDGKYFGTGDCAPLPGFSKESYDDVKEEVDLWLKGKKTASLPSLCWAIDVAMSKYQAQKKEISLTKFWSRGDFLSRDDLRIAKLYHERISISHNDVIKVKVGESSLREDISKISYIVKEFSPRKIRLDVNRKWDLSDAIFFCKKMESLPIDYIEEPCASPTDLPLLERETSLKLALDESLYKDDWEWEKFLPKVYAIILKPTLLGGIEALRRIEEKARGASCHCVVSSSFESDIGIDALKHLACAWQQEDIAAGLDTEKWFFS